MSTAVLLETLRERRRALGWWSAGVFALILISVMFYPSVEDASGLDQYAEDLPEALRALFVGGETDLSSPVGYLNSQVFAMMAPLVLAIFTIGAGAWAIAGEEERGTLDLLLAQPISRGSLVVQRFGWLALSALALSTVLFLTLLASAPLFDLDLPVANSIAATVSVLLLGVFFGALALAIGSLWPGRGRAIGVTAGIAIAAWILDGFAQVVAALEAWRPLSPYYQALGRNPLRDGAPWEGWALLVAATAALLIIAIIGLRHRDISS